MPLSFDEIIEKYRKNATSEKDKGDKFERLMQAYLLTSPRYKSILSDIWLWEDFPYKEQFGTGGKDTGIDIVCRTHSREYWAVQCKCYQANKRIDKAVVDTFASTSFIEFKSEEGKTTFSFRLWIDTTYNGFNAEAQNLANRLDIKRIGLADLKNDDVDWQALDSGREGSEAGITKYELLPHQRDAVDAVLKYFEKEERGKLIMACGTGKTFTSLRIAEAQSSAHGLVLFFVPSIALLSQTLKEWAAHCQKHLYPICICSDASANERVEDAISDLFFPATTDVAKVHKQLSYYRKMQARDGGMIVIFSTYQSIDVVSSVQKQLKTNEEGSVVFDLIICDEAHRTTGLKQKDKEQSLFTKVHSNENIEAQKRLYMTATPRLYSSDAQAKAKEKEIEVWSMDDAEWFGEEIWRIGFGEAVEKKLLSDYKVIVLTLDEHSVDRKLLKELVEEKNIKENDAIKLIGCINVLSKRTSYLTDKALFRDSEARAMKSAVAFCSSIKHSKYLQEAFNVCRQAYDEKITEAERDNIVALEAEHVDGSMGSTVRETKLDWLKNADANKRECRVLHNVRCLSEGVDVPSLDAILFLSSRNSQVDVVQSVGRVMRRAKDKKFGYIIIPVIVPQEKTAEEVLDKSDDFKTVWSILNALRSHDDRFNATINKIELNKKRPKIINVTGGGNFLGKPIVAGDDEDVEMVQGELDFDELQQVLYDKFEAFSEQVFAKMVIKCGDRRYWEDWGRDVGEIAKRNIERINALVAVDGKYKDTFEAYWHGLKTNINPSVSNEEAVEMLSQHMITKPVFEALFGGEHFTKDNPVSKALEDVATLLDERSAKDDLEKLEQFYKSVQKRVEGIDNTEGKQRVIVELYDSFFKHAFPLTVEKLGIVYTPIPIVDFILHSVEWVLQKEFGHSISDAGVNVIDPFTGTGTFITRLLQLGIIKKEDLQRKYRAEMFANEIVLLAYYIASINIENAYNEASDHACYEHFAGISLTDTFQLYEKEKDTLNDDIFQENFERVKVQQKKTITVVMGNPPYSVGQRAANDNAQNQSYPKLEKRIAETYVATSNATNNKSLYDSYIKAFRWASDRLDAEKGGVIAFVSNAGWLEGNSQEGFRKTLEKEFSSIYVFNLRGDCRTSGELRRKEAGNVFASGSRTPIAITVLVKTSTHSGKAKIFYHDIGDYLARGQKLDKISDFKSIEHLPFTLITPNEAGDWIRKRQGKFDEWIPIEADKKFNSASQSFFMMHAIGVVSSRDSWVYNYSKIALKKNVKEMIDFYNEQREIFAKKTEADKSLKVIDVVEKDSAKISWSRGIRRLLERGVKIEAEEEKIITGIYRPFIKQEFYFSDDVVECPGLNRQLFPTPNHKNIVICITGCSSTKDTTVLITDLMPSLDYVDKTQCFPLYWYETVETDEHSFLGNTKQIIRHDAVSDFILDRTRQKYGAKVQKEDIFYYVYGLLHSKSYRETFSFDLTKMLPRIPLVNNWQNFWDFSKAGRLLAELHLNYESVPPFSDVEVKSLPYNNSDSQEKVSEIDIRSLSEERSQTKEGSENDYEYYAVEKMKFLNKDEKTTIVYNQYHTIQNIPKQAYEYVVNGKSAIEWIMERYTITKDKKSTLINNPNDSAREQGKPRYILELLLSVINVSVKTMDIVDSLPEVDWDKE